MVLRAVNLSPAKAASTREAANDFTRFPSLSVGRFDSNYSARGETTCYCFRMASIRKGKNLRMISGRVIIELQNWEAFEKFDAHARANDRNHFPAWKNFNKRVRDNVGSVYGHVPQVRLRVAIGIEPARIGGRSVAMRLGRRLNEVPSVDSY